MTGLAAKADNETGAPRSALLRAYLTAPLVARRAHSPLLPAVPASPQRVCNAPPSVVVQLSGRHRAPLGPGPGIAERNGTAKRLWRKLDGERRHHGGEEAAEKGGRNKKGNACARERYKLTLGGTIREKGNGVKGNVGRARERSPFLPRAGVLPLLPRQPPRRTTGPAYPCLHEPAPLCQCARNAPPRAAARPTNTRKRRSGRSLGSTPRKTSPGVARNKTARCARRGSALLFSAPTRV